MDYSTINNGWRELVKNQFGGNGKVRNVKYQSTKSLQSTNWNETASHSRLKLILTKVLNQAPS